MISNTVCDAYLNIPSDFQEFSFSNINTDNPDFERAVIRLNEWVEALRVKSVFKPVVLYGPPGSGKTLLACCAFREVVSTLDLMGTEAELKFCGTADKSVFITGSEIADMKQREYSDGRTYEQHLYHLKNAFFAVLDDIDKCSTTETVSARLFDVIDARISKRARPTVLTMNSTPKRLRERYGRDFGEAMVDRLKRTGALFIRVPMR